MNCKKFILHIIRTVTRFLISKIECKNICVYPAFDSGDECLLYLKRLSWYLHMPLKNHLNSIIIKTNSDTEKQMQSTKLFLEFPTQFKQRLVYSRSILDYFLLLLTSKRIVFWKTRGMRVTIKILNIIKDISFTDAEDDLHCEYVEIARLPFQLLSVADKKVFYKKQSQKLLSMLSEVDQTRPLRSYVFGNGPSLGYAFDRDYSDGVRIVCNSAIKNVRLMDHIKPQFIVAGDTIWHFGCSEYAIAYRDDLRKALLRYNSYYIIPGPEAYPMYSWLGELQNRAVMIPHHGSEPVFDLRSDFRLPDFFSVFNSVMLPIAHTLTREIYICGVDGKVPHGDNEDFWPHAIDVQYDHELVKSGHDCHPTFEIRRKRFDEEVLVKQAMEKNIVSGETLHGKTYLAMFGSFMPLLKERNLKLNPPGSAATVNYGRS